MSEKKPRGFVMTLFGVVGTVGFAILAIEYVLARYTALSGHVALPAPLGLDSFLQDIPVIASVAITSAIWLGLLGAFLLLLRDRASVFVLSLAFLASLASLVWGVMTLFDGQVQIGSVRTLEFVTSLVLVSFGLWLYARTAKRNAAL